MLDSRDKQRWCRLALAPGAGIICLPLLRLLVWISLWAWWRYYALAHLGACVMYRYHRSLLFLLPYHKRRTNNKISNKIIISTMIRLATAQNASSIGRMGLRHLSKTRLVSAPSSSLATRSFSSKDDEKPKGIPYSKLTVGVPKETFPLEKRVAATPEVRL